MGGMLGAAGAGASDGVPANLDSALSVLPPEEAARWRETIEADAEQQAYMATEQQGGGFSDAYSVLRMAGGQGASGSGLLGLLGAGEGTQEE
jgi:hypothetical protein